ncbi:unnamed protein product [Sphagnum balticum]
MRTEEVTTNRVKGPRAGGIGTAKLHPRILETELAVRSSSLVLYDALQNVLVGETSSKMDLEITNFD